MSIERKVAVITRASAGHRCSAGKGLSRPQLPVDPAFFTRLVYDGV